MRPRPKFKEPPNELEAVAPDWTKRPETEAKPASSKLPPILSEATRVERPKPVLVFKILKAVAAVEEEATRIKKAEPVVKPVAEIEATLLVVTELLVISKVPEWEALVLERLIKPVMFLELPVISPPNVKALMVRVPALYAVMVLVRRPEVPVKMVARKPLDKSKLPEKELEPVLEEV